LSVSSSMLLPNVPADVTSFARSRASRNCRPRRAAIFKHSTIAWCASGVKFAMSICIMYCLLRRAAQIPVLRFHHPRRLANEHPNNVILWASPDTATCTVPIHEECLDACVMNTNCRHSPLFFPSSMMKLLTAYALYKRARFFLIIRVRAFALKCKPRHLNHNRVETAVFWFESQTHSLRPHANFPVRPKPDGRMRC